MLVDSKQEQLEPIDIIKTALEETKSQYNVQQGVAAILAEAHTPNTLVMREGNTLFIINYDPKDKSRGMFRALNADTARNYLKNSREFIKAAGMDGFKFIVVQFQDPTIMNIFKFIYRDPPFTGMGYSVQHDKQKDMYQVTINMGNTKQSGGPVAPEGVEL